MKGSDPCADACRVVLDDSTRAARKAAIAPTDLGAIERSALMPRIIARRSHRGSSSSLRRSRISRNRMRGEFEFTTPYRDTENYPCDKMSTPANTGVTRQV